MHVTTYVSASDVSNQCNVDAEFLAEILNDIRTGRMNPGAKWMDDFAEALSADGEAALRTLVVRLDAIAATSTEGR